MDRVKSGDLSTRLPAKKDDEFGIIEGHFNHMISHLSASQEKIDALHFEQLQRADKMVTLGELAAEMAHEINNPAGIIMSRTDYLLLETDEKQDIGYYKDDLEVILNQTEKISRITGSILKYSRKLPKDFKEINILKVVDESAGILRPRFEKKNITLNKSYKCEYNCPKANIFGDFQQMEQVFTNLFNNALDAMQEGGKLHVDIRCLSVSKVQVKITDTGIGMSDEVKSQILSPFYTTKSAEKGTGLGLYIAKNICNNHNAEIICESAINIGTTFTILFNKDGIQK